MTGTQDKWPFASPTQIDIWDFRIPPGYWVNEQVPDIEVRNEAAHRASCTKSRKKRKKKNKAKRR